MNATKVKTIDELPDLAFKKILSYLSLADLIKSRAVSRGWYHKINNCKVKSLFYSGRPVGFIWNKNRLVNGAFACNFIRSTKFAPFFATFGRSILSNLKRLRLFDFSLDEENAVALAQTLNSFRQLEELCIFYFNLPDHFDRTGQFKLNLPMLTSIHFNKVWGIWKLTLDAPKLRRVHLAYCLGLSLVLVHGESVERLLADRLEYTGLKDLKKLKFLYTRESEETDPTLLSGLDQLKEIHLMNSEEVENLFEQKQQYGRGELKIYFCGLCLNGPGDAAIDSLLSYLEADAFVRLAENLSRAADEMPFHHHLDYSPIERVDPEVAIDLMSRLTDFGTIYVDEPVQDIERFLNFLKNSPNIDEVEFRGDQPQHLFDRLPEHCDLQRLTIRDAPSDVRFLSRMKHLIQLDVRCSIDAEYIRNFWDELPFLRLLIFGSYSNKRTKIEISESSGWTHPKPLEVSSSPDWKLTEVSDLNAAIQLLVIR